MNKPRYKIGETVWVIWSPGILVSSVVVDHYRKDNHTLYYALRVGWTTAKYYFPENRLLPDSKATEVLYG